MILRGNIKKLIKKSREAAILAVSNYNSPQLEFKTYSYVVNMTIAWTSLFHAIFEKRGIKYFYKKNQKKLEYEKVDGEYKAWELAECCKEFYGNINSPERANLNTIIKIRNKVEHRFLPEIDSSFFGECQSCLFNYEKLLIKEFGEEHAINSSLAFAIQFSEVYEDEQLISMKSMKAKEILNIKNYIDEYRMTLDDEILNSMKYSFRVFLIPQPANHFSSCDKAIQFIKENEVNSEEYNKLKKDIIMIKNKKTPVANLEQIKPSDVVEIIKKKVNFKFNQPRHTLCWKYYKVRPESNSKTPEATNTIFCIYDELHKDYSYTKQWIEKLLKELSVEENRIKIFGNLD